MQQDKLIRIIGWIATITAIAMYVSYIDQITRNLAGVKGSIIQPLVTVLNCSLWTLYGALRRPKDWPIILANFPGIVLGAVAAATAL